MITGSTDVRLRMIVPPQPMPWVPSATMLLNLQATALMLNDGDPVSLWADTSGNHNDFLQTDPTKLPVFAHRNGFPCVHFESDLANNFASQWLQGPNFADNLPAFAIFYIGEATGNNGSEMLVKTDENTRKGWDAFIRFNRPTTAAFFINDGSNPFGGREISVNTNVLDVITEEKISNSVLHGYSNNDNSSEFYDLTDIVNDFSNTANVRLGESNWIEKNIGPDGLDGWIWAMMLYQITDFTRWPLDRSSIVSWLRAKYGL